MSSGIVSISKGKVQQAIEKAANNAELRYQFLQKLKQDRSTETPDTDWIAFLRNPSHGNLQPATESYFRESWLGSYSWRRFNVEAIVRQSLIKAIELANNPVRPIENYWIWTYDPERFEVALHATPRQVTRIIVTSQLVERESENASGEIPKAAPVIPETATELPFWVVKPYGEPPTRATAYERLKEEKPQEGWVMVQLLQN